MSDGCILWASRVAVPNNGRKQLLLELHEGHLGITKVKARARACICWIDTDIETLVKDCRPCQESRNLPPHAPLQPWPRPSRPWSRNHIDLTGPLNNTYVTSCY